MKDNNIKQALIKAYSLHDLRSVGYLTKVNLILQKWLNLPAFDMSEFRPDMHQAVIVNRRYMYTKYEQHSAIHV